MIIDVAIGRIMENPWQTREGDPDPEYIKELALDIAQNGLLQVPVGRIMGFGQAIPIVDGTSREFLYGRLKDPTYSIQLAFGHNRLAAYKWLDLDNDTVEDYSEMPVDIRTLDDKQMALMAWSENEKRRDVTPIERAKAIEKRMADFGWNQHEVADQLGVARPTVANILRLLKLPQHMQDALQEGKISARVGMSLLPMYELPEELLKQAEKAWYYAKPSTIEKKALDGNSSDIIRKEVDDLYNQWTKKLQGAEFRLDELFTEGLTVGGYDFDGDQVTVYCGLCRTCDRRLKDSGNVCMDPDCFTAKTTLHRRKYLAAASGACGIEVVDPNKGGQPTYFPSYQNETTEKIIKSKCENLRLVYDQGTGGAARVDRHPHAKVVCDKRNGSCTCLKGLSIAATRSVPSKGVDAAVQAEKEMDPDYEGDDVDVEYEGDNPDEDLVRMIDEEKEAEVRAQTVLDLKQLEELVRQQRKDKADVGRHVQEAKQKVKKVLVEGLRNNQPGAYYLVLKGSAYVYDQKELDIEKIYSRLAEGVVDVVINAMANNVDELYEIINRKLSRLGLDAVYPYETLIEQFAEVES